MSGSPASAAFHNRILSLEALYMGFSHHLKIAMNDADHAMCRPSGKGTTHDTTPELAGFRKVFKSRGLR